MKSRKNLLHGSKEKMTSGMLCTRYLHEDQVQFITHIHSANISRNTNDVYGSLSAFAPDIPSGIYQAHRLVCDYVARVYCVQPNVHWQ